MGCLVLLIFCVAASSGIIKYERIIYWNFSASEPRGFYRVVAFDQLKRGDMVVMRVPETAEEYFHARNWSRDKIKLLKTVYAVEGDSYSVTATEIRVNGKYIGPVFEQDQNGLKLPAVRGDFVVKKGHFLPLALNLPNSFDGRYLGEISAELILNKVEPFIILECLFKD